MMPWTRNRDLHQRISALVHKFLIRLLCKRRMWLCLSVTRQLVTSNSINKMYSYFLWMCLVVITMYNHITSDQIRVVAVVHQSRWPLLANWHVLSGATITSIHNIHISFDMRFCCRSRFPQFICAQSLNNFIWCVFDTQKVAGMRTEWETQLQHKIYSIWFVHMHHCECRTTTSKIHSTFEFNVVWWLCVSVQCTCLYTVFESFD